MSNGAQNVPDDLAQYAVKPGKPGAVPDDLAQYAVKPEAAKKLSVELEPSRASKALGVGSDLLQGVGEGALQTVGTISKGLHKIPGIGEYLAPQQGIEALSKIATPENLTQRIGAAGEQVGEIAATGPSKAALKSLAGRLPALGKFALPATRIGTEAVTAGTSAALHDQPVGLSALLGAGGATLVEGLGAMAPGLIESALGVGQRLRGRGRTIGEAVLEQTKGMRPATIAKETGEQIKTLTQQMESHVNAATTAGATGSTQGAHTILNDAIAKLPRNARPLIDKMKELHELLDLRPAGAAGPAPVSYTPTELLEMKRGIGKAIDTWPPEWQRMGDIKRIEQQLYGAIDKELDRLVPGNKELNQKISSLIPARSAAIQKMSSAKLPERIAHRMAAHTGALAGGVAGSILGYEKGGLRGAVLGGTAGVLGPEIMASPGTQIALARAMASDKSIWPFLRALLLQKQEGQ